MLKLFYHLNNRTVVKKLSSSYAFCHYRYRQEYEYCTSDLIWNIYFTFMRENELGPWSSLSRMNAVYMLKK